VAIKKEEKKNTLEKQKRRPPFTCTKRVRDGRRCPGQASKGLLSSRLWLNLAMFQAESVPVGFWVGRREVFPLKTRA
jgi:hypothetical protein